MQDATDPHAAAQGDPTAEQLTLWLEAAGRGDRSAFDAAFAGVYGELRRLAGRVRQGRASDTLSATALVHEAYFKLARSVGSGDAPQWIGRQTFLKVAARAMRQVLANAARDRLTDKRGGGALPVTLDESIGIPAVHAEQVVAVDELLQRLEVLDERQARVVECRFFGGLSVEETAEALGISAPTVQRDWRSARAWLAKALDELGEAGPSADGGDHAAVCAPRQASRDADG
ncbi:MAG: ECF-type sigma factor [Gemmatimonadota bacterium]